MYDVKLVKYCVKVPKNLPCHFLPNPQQQALSKHILVECQSKSFMKFFYIYLNITRKGKENALHLNIQLCFTSAHLLKCLIWQSYVRHDNESIYGYNIFLHFSAT